MSEAKHTPGPWSVSHGLLPPHPLEGVYSDDGDHICSFSHLVSVRLAKDVYEANARLVSAAPDMLAALKAVEWGQYGECVLCGMRQEYPGYHKNNCQLAAAIAKAEGRA